MFITFLRSIVIFCLVLVCAGCEAPITNRHSSGTTIVCFGASLTQGVGADPGYDYPSYLRKMVDLPVVNAGISGNTTQQELLRLQADVLDKNPKIVIITQRVNDIKNNIPKEETLKNLETIIDQIQGHEAIAVVATFEPVVLRERYFKDIRKLVLRKHAVLIPNIVDGIEFDPKYMHDDAHPNNEGYRIVAQRIYKSIKDFLK